jgi:hypothetical protein
MGARRHKNVGREYTACTNTGAAINRASALDACAFTYVYFRIGFYLDIAGDPDTLAKHYLTRLAGIQPTTETDTAAAREANLSCVAQETNRWMNPRTASQGMQAIPPPPRPERFEKATQVH